jgi:hypothetical protein
MVNGAAWAFEKVAIAAALSSQMIVVNFFGLFQNHILL